jgi:kynurenine formamidase
MQTVYLSHFIDSDIPVYGGAVGEIVIEPIRSIDKGDTSNNLHFTFPAHIGTHIDFPYHFSNEGKKSNDYPPSFWIFHRIGFLNCTIEEVESNLDTLDADIEILILKTGFGTNRHKDIYWSGQPVIPAKFATLFKNKFPKLRVFGFDLLSLTSKLDRAEGKSAHINFLIHNDILVLEDMNLENIVDIPKVLVVAPLQINAADGVPCTVIAF